MNTFLNSSQIALEEQYSKFVNEVVAPIAADLDTGKACAKEIMTKFGQSGYLGITIAKEFGGQGGTLVEAALFVEALSKHAAGLALAVASHYSVVESIVKYGSATHKSRYLPLLARGELFGAQAFSEEEAGSDLSMVSTVATKSDKEVKVEGCKTWVVNVDLPALLAVVAKNGASAEGQAAQFGFFLIQGQQTDSSLMAKTENTDFALSSRREVMGFRSAAFYDITLNSKTPTENCLSETDGIKIAEACLDVSKTLVAACALGLASESLTQAAHRANTRQQFGAPIAKNQGVQWKLADHSTETSSARLLTYRAAWAHEGDTKEFHKFAAMAKYFAAKTARVHSGEAVQIFGMLGASCQEPLERIYRDAKLTEIFEGTSELQKVIIKEELGV